VKNFCKDKVVLDVGRLGQDIDYKNPNWIHNQVKKVSKSVVGVDINESEIEKIKKLGYDICHFTQLDKSKTFDVVLMLDVIGHVDNPVEFLNYYKSFLKLKGKLIITTPNANRVINSIFILLNNDYPINYEHTFWFCPKTFLELVRRVNGLKPVAFYWIKNYDHYHKNKASLKRKIVFNIIRILGHLRSNLFPNFMFVLEKIK